MSTTELTWFKSSYSGSQGDDCVEVAVTDHAIHIRDSKDTTRHPFTINPNGWQQFVRFTTHD